MKRIFCLQFVLIVFSLFVSCEKYVFQGEILSPVDFTASIEPLDNESQSKVRLVNEEWIYWEIGDSISIGSNTSTQDNYTAILTLPSVGSDFEGFNGAFQASLPEGSKYFLGLHPENSSNVIRSTGGTNFSATIILPDEQPLRNDITFAKQVFPMVAWYGGEWDDSHPVPFNLDFHSLAGIVRFQIFNSGVAKTIRQITVTSLDGKQLKGAFTVNNYKTFDPYLTPANNTSANQKVVLTCGESGLPLGSDSLRSFYLVLPALGGMGVTTSYGLKFEIEATDGSVCTKTMTAGIPVRRNGITYRNAIDVKDWSSASATVGLVGNGTESRPFKIYTIKDLQYLRKCYASIDRKINNQPITANTWIRIMRSDIVLTSENWTAGINRFEGHFTCVSAPSAGNAGITNKTNIPLFVDIKATGVVEGIDMRVTATATDRHTATDTAFTPFCRINRGIIRNCDVTTANECAIYSTWKSVAGLCVNNFGTIEGCNCSATLRSTNAFVAGICLYNHGTIRGCQISSPMTVIEGSRVGGICYQNINNSSAVIEDCYFDATVVGSASQWGGIVHTMSGGTLKHCSNTGTVQSVESVAGIVHTITAGTVNYCWSQAKLKGNMAGGIAVNVNGGRIINSFVNTNNAQVVLNTSNENNSAGGFAATISGGSIENGFVNITHVQRINSTGITAGFVGKATGGTITNCYSYESAALFPVFYGTNTSTSYNSCYLVGNNTQSYVTSVTTTQALSGGGLVQQLNNNVPSGGKSWELTDDMPQLTAYSASKRRKGIR